MNDYRIIAVLHRGQQVHVAYWVREHTPDTVDWTFCTLYPGDGLHAEEPEDPTPAEEAAIQTICERDFRERRAAFLCRRQRAAGHAA